VDWNAIGALGEIVGAIAVIGTLVYLARQISQSGINARASQISMLNQSYAALNDLIVGSPHAISALKSVENPERASADEGSVLLRHLMYKWFNLWVSAQMAFANGQLNEAEFEIYKNDFRNIQDLYPGLMPYLIEELQRYPAAKKWAIFAPIAKSL
jgi:hypothetical protein